jgi:5'-methylthioadenosine phosphorylase
MASDWILGIIGGSGLYDFPGLEDVQQIPVASAFGDPSGPVTLGRLGKVKLVFMARHGEGHRLPPSSINYRANIDVMKRCGVTDLVALSAVGSLAEDIAPGDFVTASQFIDRTVGRERSFFGPGLAAHVPMADPVCPRLAGFAAKAAKKTGVRVHESSCYVAIEGPQFSTRAESHLYRSWGAQVIGMTAMPEARLAREAELPYALIGLVTDYDCWREEGEGVDAEAILAVMRENAGRERDMVVALAGILPAKRKPSPIDTVLDSAIVTPRPKWDPAAALRLDAVAGRLLRNGTASPS